MLASRSNTFPTDPGDLVAISFRYHTDWTFQQKTHAALKTGVIVIYHDFVDDVKAGFSGNAFAKSVLNWCSNKIFRPCYLVEANTNITDLMGKLAQIKAKCGDVVIDTILIATHGSPGQLWLGNPDNMHRSNAIGLGGDFVSAQTFGSGLLELFGSGLAIAIYSCNFLSEWEGKWEGVRIALELRTASRARAIYAAEGEVHLTAPKADRPTVQCTRSYVVYEDDQINVHVAGAMPVFDM